MVDNKFLKLKDVDLNYVATNSVKEKNYLNPERNLVRYQFMEILVRIAVDKYYKKGIS